MKAVFSDVFFDVDTQVDFVDPNGALYVPGAETILDRVAALNHFAEQHAIPVVSTMDAHTPDDPEFRDWPQHCVAGTPGQRKPPGTVLASQSVIPNRKIDLPAKMAAQIVLEKQKLDCFSNPNLPALLEQLHAERYVVYGVVTEICVRHAAMGLLQTGARVEVVTDAVRSLNDADRDRFLTEFEAAGGTLITTDRVLRGAAGG